MTDFTNIQGLESTIELAGKHGSYTGLCTHRKDHNFITLPLTANINYLAHQELIVTLSDSHDLTKYKAGAKYTVEGPVPCHFTFARLHIRYQQNTFQIDALETRSLHDMRYHPATTQISKQDFLNLYPCPNPQPVIITGTDNVAQAQVAAQNMKLHLIPKIHDVLPGSPHLTKYRKKLFRQFAGSKKQIGSRTQKLGLISTYQLKPNMDLIDYLWPDTEKLLAAAKVLGIDTKTWETPYRQALYNVQQHYQKYIHKLAKPWLRHHVNDAENIIDAGTQGLIHAVQKFDTSRDNTFMTYARHWVLASIGKYCAKESGLSQDVQMKLKRIHKISIALEGQLERTPTHQEIALKAGLQVKTIRELKILERRAYTQSIDEVMDETGTFGQLLELRDYQGKPANQADQTLMDKEQRTHLDRGLQQLSPKQEKILRALYFEERTLEDVGQEFGFSREYIRQIRNKALTKLKVLITQQESDF